MITIGCANAGEAREDIEISLAALERRFPEIENRDSPKVTSVISGVAQE